MAIPKNDKALKEEILKRGVEKIYPNYQELEKKLDSNHVLRIYCGFDPSAKSLHIGNAIALVKLRQFQRAGHKVIFLIGSFTGMIGDPSGKTVTRKQLTRDEVLLNSSNFQSQAKAYINFEGDNPAELRFNHEWLDQLTFRDLIAIGSNFTVQMMIQRDMFQKRIMEEKPIFLHEFFYPLAQAYDSVKLDIDIEVGGNDQMFNMMCGRDLQKAINGREKFVLTMKLLADNNGKKMGKSEGNAFFLDDSASDMYGKVMSWTDDVLPSAFELCTFVEMTEVKELLKDLNNNPRDLKMRLAYEITKINHGEKLALEAQDYFIKTVQNKEIPEEIEERKVDQEKMNIVDLLVFLEMVSSKSEARRLVEQGGIKIGKTTDLQVVSDVKIEIKIENNLIIQRGKRQFIKIVK